MCDDESVREGEIIGMWTHGGGAREGGGMRSLFGWLTSAPVAVVILPNNATMRRACADALHQYLGSGGHTDLPTHSEIKGILFAQRTSTVSGTYYEMSR
jgi:hypothetical protein